MAILSMALFLLLLFWLQQKIYRRYWDRRLDLRLSFSAREAFEGERLVLKEELTNSKLLPLPWVVAKFQLSRGLVFPGSETARVSDDYYQNDMFSVGIFQRITRRQEFVCGARGYYRIKNLDLSSNNILISDHLVKRLSCDAKLTVLPKLIPADELDIVYRQIFGDIEVKRFTNPDPFTFRGIREYQAGDDFRSVNFKASAKTGELMVNLSAATASQELVLLLNLQKYADWDSGDVYEEAIRIAASAAERFGGMGLAVGLYSNGRDVTTHSPVRVLPGSGSRHAHGILEKLARVDLSLEQEPMAPMLDSLEDGPVYLLISSYDGPEIADAFDRMLERGLSARWILPTLPDTVTHVKETDVISRWELLA
ncbi:MAG: DUF58 domain-containing protein [Oscillospiraceae bacterium]